MDLEPKPALPYDLTRTAIVRKLDRLAYLESEHLRLQTMLETDPLTGIKNECGLERAVGGRAGWYVLADLNGFKGINDEHGHAAGDLVLREFAGFLQLNTRQEPGRTSDLVTARLHGDEFAVWTEHRAGARRIKHLIRAWRSTHYPEASASAGIGEDLKAADASMYLNKRRAKRLSCQDGSQRNPGLPPRT